MRIHQLFFAKAPEAAARSLEALWMKGRVSEGLQGTCIILVEVRRVGSQNSFIEDVGLPCKNSSLALLQDLERGGADLIGWVLLRVGEVGVCELKIH